MSYIQLFSNPHFIILLCSVHVNLVFFLQINAWNINPNVFEIIIFFNCIFYLDKYDVNEKEK